MSLRILSSALAIAAVLSTIITAAESGKAPVTYAKDVAPILYKNCANCHRPGELAPMSLLTYQDARPWAKSIKEAVVARKMPPWLADPNVGHFANDRRLSQPDIDTIVSWVNSGAPQGNAADMPPAPQIRRRLGSRQAGRSD
ncbi:MAG TPA: hypothetical protein VIX89_00135 [Bryobacteraceae bacterium]